MIKLPVSLQRWHSHDFKQALKDELEHLPAGTLPLEQGTSRGGFVDDSDISVSVTHTTENRHSIQVRAGVFFTEIITGCGCGDEPLPENAHCVLRISIDKSTAAAEFEVIQN